MSDSNKVAGFDEDAPLPIRLRSDLVAELQPAGLGVRWAIKDPLALQYFHFQEREWQILNLLDGTHSFCEIRQAVSKHFGQAELDPIDFSQFLQRAYLDGLLLVDRHGQGHRIVAQSEKAKRKERTGRMISVLAIRFRGIDPTKLLDFLSPVGTILFHPVTFVMALVFGLGTLVAATLQAEQVSARLPEMGWFIQGQNLIWMMVALSIVKVLHELGHGLACRRFGGECHEMGVMLLAFTPCLYVNVSDAWMFPSRLKRMVVSAAGIYVELILASICFLGWYLTFPGVLNSVLLNVVFICSVNTLFLNGNPLLRYDGYYIATDLFDVPNLSAQAKAALWTPIRNFVTRRELRQRVQIHWRLATFAVASIAYRFVVISTIAWFVYTTLKSYQMKAVGQILVGVVLFGILMPLIIQLHRFVRQPGAFRMIHWFRFGSIALILLAMLTVGLSIPLPTHLKAPVAVEARDAAYVYAPMDGRIRWNAELGTVVEDGMLVCEMENEKLERELLDVELAIAEANVRIDAMQQTLLQDEGLASRLVEAAVEIERLEERQKTLEKELARARIFAARSGRVIAAPESDRIESRPHSLPTREGSVFSPKNQGCFVERSELLCIIGSGDSMQVVIYVGQEEIELVQLDSQVEVRLDQQPHQVLKGVVAEISREEMQSAPETLASSGEFNVRPSQGSRRPVSTSYRVTVSFDDTIPELIYGSGGRARILADKSSLGSRLVRYLSRTIRVDL